MRRPLALDLFCKAGGAARGLHAAGFEVVGVDIEDQPNYPYDFIRADALRFMKGREAWKDFKFIWASPPCLDNTALRAALHAKRHEDLIDPVRELLLRTGLPYVIENVDSARARARLRNPVKLCGSMFGLGVWASPGEGYSKRVFQLRRHRLFEANFPIPQPKCKHSKDPVIGVYGGHARTRSASVGGRRTLDFEGEDRPRIAATALGLVPGCMTMDELSNAIPPAYAAHIGRAARAALPLFERTE